MKNRCSNPKVWNYNKYGGRGIHVCDRWLHSFENFFADMGPRPSSRHSIERENRNGNYEPDNCHWALPTEQAANRSNERLLTVGGERLSLTTWAHRLGANHTTILARLKSGWSVERAVTEPVRGQHP